MGRIVSWVVTGVFVFAWRMVMVMVEWMLMGMVMKEVDDQARERIKGLLIPLWISAKKNKQQQKYYSTL